MLMQFEQHNRQKAPRESRKNREVHKGKNRGGICATSCKWSTHIMLRCCVLARAGKAKKTAIYIPRQISRHASKAHLCCSAPYCQLLETAYVNSLRYRPIDLLRMVRER
jgi:hypothetical protein